MTLKTRVIPCLPARPQRLREDGQDKPIVEAVAPC
jgi:hypothetical protein